MRLAPSEAEEVAMSGRQSRTLAFPEFADCFCARMPNRLPDRYPVTPRYELARRIPIVVATRGNERLLCTMEHNGPHAWPVLELLEPLPDPYAEAPDGSDEIVPAPALPAAADDPVLAIVADDAPTLGNTASDSAAPDGSDGASSGAAPVADAAAYEVQPINADIAVEDADTAGDVTRDGLVQSPVQPTDEIVVQPDDAANVTQFDDPVTSAPVADVVTDDAEAAADEPAGDIAVAVAGVQEAVLDASLVESIEPVAAPASDVDLTDDVPSAATADDTSTLIDEFFADTAEDAAVVVAQEWEQEQEQERDAAAVGGLAAVEVIPADDKPMSAILPEVLDADEAAIPYKVDAPDDVDIAEIVTDAAALASQDDSASDVQHARTDANAAAHVEPAISAQAEVQAEPNTGDDAQQTQDEDEDGHEEQRHARNDEPVAGNSRSQE